MKFTDVPVSPYTGTTDVTIPIYTIQEKGITVPLSVSYHTEGIKLKEEASSVGLGWALNAGGMISRNIMGSDDFGTQGNTYFTNLCPQLPGDISSSQFNQGGPMISPYYFDFWCTYKVNTSDGTEDFYPAFTTKSNPYEMEPDIFSYNFPGHSGKFILTRSGQVVMQKQENIRIKFQGSGNHVTFSITDDQGNTFYFSVLEVTAVSPKPAQISSWMLSKIVTQQGETITFNYQSIGSTTSGSSDVYQTYSHFCTEVQGLFTNDNYPPYYTNQTLASIDFTNGHLQFGYEGGRADLNGSYKLDSIMIYSKTSAGTQIYLKQENFYYSYFNSFYHPINEEYYRLKLDSVKETSGGLSLPPYYFIYNNPNPGSGSDKHSYNVDHWGYFNEASNGNEGSNGNLIPTMDVNYQPANNASGVPQVLHYSGANRQPAFPAMQTFSLHQVTYPTGGKTVLAYSPNDYDYGHSAISGGDGFQYVQVIQAPVSPLSINKHGYTTGTFDLTNIYPVIPSGGAGTNFSINVAFRFQNSHTGNFPYTTQSGKLYFDIGGASIFDADISGANCTQGSIVCTKNETLAIAPGVYQWTAYIDPSIDTATVFAEIDVGIIFNETQAEYNLLQNGSNISPASGLRIDSIINYKDASSIASKKVYSYNYTQGNGTGQQQYSYGRLMSIPSYARYSTTSTSGGGYCTALILSGSSITSLTSQVQGNIVGYDQVTETNVDPVSNQDIGKTVYSYFNSSDTANRYAGYGVPGVLNMGNNLNGLLTSKVSSANNGATYAKVDEINNYYHTASRIVYFSPKYESISASGVIGSGCKGDTGVATQTLAWFYPSIKSEKILLDSTKHILYGQGDMTKYASTTIADFYDNPVHYQVTRIKTSDSKGNVIVNGVKYPQDYLTSGHLVTGNTILDSLIRRNMIGEAIEKRDSLFHAGSLSTSYVSSAQLNLYRILSGSNNTIVPDKIYKLDIQSPVTDFTPFSVNGNTTNMDTRYRQMISYNSYDQSNNLQQFTGANQIPVSIIWDYLNVYPIAQTVNAAQSNIAYTSFEADGTGNWTINSAGISTSAGGFTGEKCYGLSSANTMTKTGLTSGNYIVTYWKKVGVTGTVSINGGSPGTSVIAKRGWTLYSRTLSNVTSVTITGAGAAIDEVRLYPADAQMTTYAYSPLIGMTSQCDAANRLTTYEYDGLGRLTIVRDQENNIVKKIDYHYNGQPEASPSCSCDNPSIGKRCINDQCQQGVRVNTVTTRQNNGTFKCVYHWEWPNFSGIGKSANVTEYNADPCFVD